MHQFKTVMVHCSQIPIMTFQQRISLAGVRVDSWVPATKPGELPTNSRPKIGHRSNAITASPRARLPQFDKTAARPIVNLLHVIVK